MTLSSGRFCLIYTKLCVPPNAEFETSLDFVKGKTDTKTSIRKNSYKKQNEKRERARQMKKRQRNKDRQVYKEKILRKFNRQAKPIEHDYGQVCSTVTL